MRGRCDPQLSMPAFVDPDARVPPAHPPRAVEDLADRAPAARSPVFDAMYAAGGRPAVPAARPLQAGLLVARYPTRGERAFCEEPGYRLPYRWFPDLDPLAPGFDASAFAKHRRRPPRHAVLQAHRLGLLSDARLTVDGTPIGAAAGLGGFRPKHESPLAEPVDDPGNPAVDCRGGRRSNATRQSTTGPEARLMRKGKGKEAKLAYPGHALMENRNGLLLDLRVTQATGAAERDAVPVLLDEVRERGFRPRTLGADKGYDTRDCVAAMRRRKVTPHWPRTRPGGAAPSTGGPPAGPATRSARASASGWRRSSAG